MRTAILAAGLALAAAQPVPLPNTPDVLWRSGSPTAQVVLDAHMDLLCPDSAASWFTAMKTLPTVYTASQLTIVLHLFPLPYHTWAFTIAQGANVVRSINASDAAMFAYIDTLFNVQDTFYTGNTVGNSSTQVVSVLASIASAATGVSASAFTAGMADPNLNEDTRVSWKYGCSRSVTGTPSFFVNGVPVAADATWTLAQWQALLDPLFTGAPRAKLVGRS